MDQSMKENLGRIKLKVKELINGSMEKFIRDNGKDHVCMEKDIKAGQTVKCIKETLLKTKDMASVILDGQMVENTKANGLMENNMALEIIKLKMAIKKEEHGKMVKEQSGHLNNE